MKLTVKNLLEAISKNAKGIEMCGIGPLDYNDEITVSMVQYKEEDKPVTFNLRVGNISLGEYEMPFVKLNYMIETEDEYELRMRRANDR